MKKVLGSGSQTQGLAQSWINSANHWTIVFMYYPHHTLDPLSQYEVAHRYWYNASTKPTFNKAVGNSFEPVLIDRPIPETSSLTFVFSKLQIVDEC